MLSVAIEYLIGLVLGIEFLAVGESQHDEIHQILFVIEIAVGQSCHALTLWWCIELLLPYNHVVAPRILPSHNDGELTTSLKMSINSVGT